MDVLHNKILREFSVLMVIQQQIIQSDYVTVFGFLNFKSSKHLTIYIIYQLFLVIETIYFKDTCFDFYCVTLLWCYKIFFSYTLQVPNEKIVMRWRLKSWPDAHFSEVTMNFLEKGGSTILKLKQTGVPSSEYEKTIEGWNVNYWMRIKQVFGFGTHIF